MSQTTPLTAPADPADPPRPRTAWPTRRAARLAWLFAAAWLIPALAHLLSVDWLLPPLVLVVTAGLLRSGRSLLDRLVLATTLLLGAGCAAGLLFTVWPFGLHPVALAGSALTVLAVLAVRRRPTWPRPSLADGLTVLAAVAVAGYLARPYRRNGLTARLALQLVGEDNARHMTIFDTVRRLGGYPFAYGPADVPDLFERMRFYPAGWHLIAGLLDGFLRSSTRSGSTVSMLTHYAGFTLAGYALFALVLIWAARRVAGPLLAGWRVLPVIAFLGVLLVYSDLPTMLTLGFPSEVIGLTLLAVLAAVVVRPLESAREQVLLLGAVLVGIGFTYYLLLPPAGLVALVALYADRRRLRPHRVLVLAAAVVVAALALTPAILGLLLADQGGTLAAGGGVNRVSRATLMGMAALIGAGVLTRAGRRLRLWHRYAWLFLIVSGTAGLVGAYQLVEVGHTTYYFEKALHAVAITLLVGIGGTALLLAPPRRREGLRSPTLLPAAALSFAIVAALGAVAADSPYRPSIRFNPGRWWASGEPGREVEPHAATVLAADRQVPRRDGTVTVILTDAPYQSYRTTLFLSTLQRTSGATADLLYEDRPGTRDSVVYADTADKLVELIRRLPAGVVVRLVPATAEAEALAAAVRDRLGDRVEVQRLVLD